MQHWCHGTQQHLLHTDTCAMGLNSTSSHTDTCAMGLNSTSLHTDTCAIGLNSTSSTLTPVPWDSTVSPSTSMVQASPPHLWYSLLLHIYGILSFVLCLPCIINFFFPFFFFFLSFFFSYFSTLPLTPPPPPPPPPAPPSTPPPPPALQQPLLRLELLLLSREAIKRIASISFTTANHTNTDAL